MSKIKGWRWGVYIDYNSPIVLTFTLICVGVFFLDLFSRGWFTYNLFSINPRFSFSNPLSYLTLITHVFGHASVQHLTLNLAIILLVGPILEEKYGPKSLLTMCLITAVATGLLNVIIFSQGLVGASGIAFMFILLSSFTNVKKGTIPMTFILVAILYLGNEFYHAFDKDNISQFAHFLGGACGSLFGYYSRST